MATKTRNRPHELTVSWQTFLDAKAVREGVNSSCTFDYPTVDGMRAGDTVIVWFGGTFGPLLVVLQIAAINGHAVTVQFPNARG
jgi:hypothetical protein